MIGALTAAAAGAISGLVIVMANSSSTKRLRDDTDGNLHRHNVGLQSVTGSYSISFDSAFMQRDVRLIEVSEDLVNCLISGESLNIIGPVEASGKGDDSHAVLTTGHKTFSIKKVETSNAVYLLNPSNSDVFTIHSASQDYYELKLIPPRISKIRDLLQSSVYDGMDCEAMSNIEQSNLLSYNELRCQVQASDTEFSAALFSFGVVELRGKMRQLSKQAIAETTKQLIYTIIENDWDIDNISEESCSTSIPDTDPILLNFSLKSLGESITSSSLQDKIGSNFWALNKDAVSRATAHNLFRAQGQSTKVTHFISVKHEVSAMASYTTIFHAFYFSHGSVRIFFEHGMLRLRVPIFLTQGCLKESR